MKDQTIRVEAKGDVTISADEVGRDKIEERKRVAWSVKIGKVVGKMVAGLRAIFGG